MSLYPLCLVALIAACGGGSGGPADPDGALGECPRTWTVETPTQGATATLANDQLALQTPSVPAGTAIAVERELVDVDFDISFSVPAVTLGGPGAYVRATIASAEGSTYIGARIAPDGLRVEANTLPLDIETWSPTTAQLMSLRFARSEGKLDAVATAGNESAGVLDFVFTDTPLTLRLELGGSEANASPTSATFGGFDCAALDP